MLVGQWSEALAANNIRTILHWLKKLDIKGDACLEEHLQTFGCWLQRTSELNKKELLTLCFSRCQGLWMFLDRSSFIKIHMLLQRLQNLLILVQWSRKQQGVGTPCMICRDTQHSSDGKHDCWNRELWTLKQHIWLGRLVQWWGIMGLLPRFPEAQELRRISQMWKEMELSHQQMCLKTAGWNKREMERYGFLIEGMVMQLCKKHGCIWTSEDCTDQCYPPPTLQALLMLVLVPCIDNMLIQGILLYFILDVANFLQCKDNLLRSFCHAFTIPPSFSQQIQAFWMFDRGQTKASMELLLSPRTTVAQLSWQHRCIIISLLKRKQHHMALKYLQWIKPPIETIEDAKLCAEVLLQSSCVSDAWALLKRSHSESEDMVMYFLQACRGINLGAEAVKYIPEGYSVCKCDLNDTPQHHGKEDCSKVEATILQLTNKDCFSELAPCPLSATLYQNQAEGTMCSEELVKLFKKAMTEVRKPHANISEVVWPKQPKRKSNSREMFLSVQALRRLTPSPFSMEALEETEQTANTEDYQKEHYALNPNLPETQEDILSSENQSSLSASSFSSGSSAPLLKHHHVFDSTITLQKISAFLTDQEMRSEGDDNDDDEEDKFTSVTDFLPHFSELKLTTDGAIKPLSLSNYGNKTVKSQDKEFSYPLQGEGEDKKYTPGVKLADAYTKSFSSVAHKRVQSDGFLEISEDQEGREQHQQKEIQPEGDESAGWGLKVRHQGAMRSGRTQSRKGKRVKRT